MLIRAFAVLVTVLPLSAAEWSWPVGQRGEALPSGWTLAKAATSSATVAFADGGVVLAADRGWHAMLSRELDQVDGSDAAPLRFEGRIAALTPGVPKGGPTGFALYWTPRHWVVLGQASWDGYRPDPDPNAEPHRRRAWCSVDDGTERRSVAAQTEVRGHSMPGWYRIVVTSKAISAQVSSDGQTYEEVINLPRSAGGFSGPPRLALIGRPGWGEPGTEAAGLAADADDGRLTGSLATWRIDGVQLTNDLPSLAADAKPLPTASERAPALAAAFTVPAQWEAAGPIPFDVARIRLLKQGALASGGECALPDGTKLPWKELKRQPGATSPVVPVEQVISTSDRQMVVLRTTLRAEQLRDERFWFDGAARGVWVWIDDHRLGEEWIGDGQPTMDPDRQSAVATLTPGEHRVVVVIATIWSNPGARFALRHGPADRIWWSALHERLAVTYKADDTAPGDWLTAARWRDAAGDAAGAAGLLERMLASDALDESLVEAGTPGLARLARQRRDTDAEKNALRRLATWRAQGQEGVALARRLVDEARRWLAAGFKTEALAALDRAAAVSGLSGDEQLDLAYERARLLSSQGDSRGARTALEAMTRVLSATHPALEEVSAYTALLAARAGEQGPGEALLQRWSTSSSVQAEALANMLCGAALERNDHNRRVELLRRLAALAGARRSAWYDAQVHLAEALVAPADVAGALATAVAPTDAAAVAVAPTDAAATAAVTAYQVALMNLPWRDHASVTPRRQRAETALKERKPQLALAQLRVAYLLATLCEDEAGRQLATVAAQVADQDAVTATSAGSATQAMDPGWHVIGAFPLDNWKAYDRVIVDPNKVEVTKDVEGRKWRKPGPEAYAGGFIDFAPLFGQDNSVCFAYREFTAKAAGPVEISCGADDGLVLWVNGQKVHEDREQRSVDPDSIRIPVQFVAGVNRVLAMVQQGGAGWGFQCRVNVQAIDPLGAQLAAMGLNSALHGSFQPALHQFAVKARRSGRNAAAVALSRAAVRGFPDVPGRQLDTAGLWWEGGLTDERVARELAWWAEGLAQREDVPPAKDQPRFAHTLRLQALGLLSRTGDFEGVRQMAWRARLATLDGDVIGILLAQEGEALRRGGQGFAAVDLFSRALDVGLSDQNWRNHVNNQLPSLRRVARTSGAPLRPNLEAATLLSTSDRALVGNDVERAVRGWQRLLTEFADQPVVDAGRWAGAGALAQERLRAAPPAVQAQYRTAFEASATVALKLARQLGGRTALETVAARFPLTASAATALSEAAALALDAGDAAAAADLHARLAQDATGVVKAQALAWVALTAGQAGDRQRAEAALATLEQDHANDSLTIAGRPQVARALATAQRRSASVAATAIWSGAGGDARRTAQATGVGQPAACGWLTTLPVAPADQAWDLRLAPLPWRHAGLQPALGGGLAVVHTLDESFALRLADGQLAWRSGSPWAALDRSPRDGAWAGAVETATALAGGRCLVRRGHGLTDALAVECRTLADGALRWSTAGGELTGWSAVSSPAAGGGRVMAVFQEAGETRRRQLVALDLDSGAVCWRVPVPGAVAGMPIGGQGVLPLGHGAAPTLAGGAVYWCTDGGLVACWDASAGLLRWAAVLPRGDLDADDGRRAVREVAGRAASRVVVGTDTVFVAPGDALGVYAIDRSTGRLRWQRPLHGARQLAALAEGAEAALIVQDGFVEALDPANGATRWRWRPAGEGETPCGSAAVVDGHVLVTTEAGLYRLRLSDGRAMSLLRWAQAGVDLAGGGNVAIADGTVLVAGRERLALVTTGGLTKPLLGNVPALPVHLAPAVPAGDTQVSGPLALRWQLPGPQPTAIQRLGTTDEVLISSDDRLQRVVAATGQVRWVAPLTPDLRSVHSFGEVILGVGPRHVVCHDAADGRMRWMNALETDDAGWSFGRQPHELWVPTVDADAGRVVISHVDGRGATLLDGATGKELRQWRFASGGARWLGLHADALVGIFSDEHKTWVEGFAVATGATLGAQDLEGVRRDARWWRTARSANRGRLALATEHTLAVLDLAQRRLVGRSKEWLGEECWVASEGDGWATYGRREEKRWTAMSWGADGSALGAVVYSGGDGPWHAAHPRVQGGRVFFITNQRPNDRVNAVCTDAAGKILWERDVGHQHQQAWATSIPLGDRLGVLWYRDSGQRACWTLLAQSDGGVDSTGDLPGGLGRCRNNDPGLVSCGGVVIYPGAGGGVFAVGARRDQASDSETAKRAQQAVQRPLAVAFSTRGALTVDGRVSAGDGDGALLDQPSAVRNEPGGAWAGAADTLARINWRWSRDLLVAAVAVTDDAVVTPPPGALLDGDGLLLAIASQAEDLNRQDVGAPLLLHIALTGAGTRCLRLGGPLPDSPEQQPTARAVRTATGVAYEIGIPWSLLRADPGKRPGEQPLLGAGLAVLDADPGRPGTMLEWGAGLARGLDGRLLPRINALDLTPERLASFAKLRVLLPDHALTGDFLNTMIEGFPGAGGAARRAVELEGFVRDLPQSTFAVRALVRLAEAYRDGGVPATEADAKVASFARAAKVPMRTIGDAIGPALAEGAGRALSLWVWLDPKDPPRTIMLQVHDGEDWEQRAVWGADSIARGPAGIPSRTVLGPLPAPGVWTQLTIPVARLHLDGMRIAYLAPTIDTGRAVWDLFELLDEGKRTVLLDDEWPKDARPTGGDWITDPVKSGNKAVTNGDKRSQYEFHTDGHAPYADLRRPAPGDTPERWRDEFSLMLKAAGVVPDEPEAATLLLAAEDIAARKRFPTAPASDVPLREFLAAHPDSPHAGRLLGRLAERWQGENGKDRAAALERCVVLMDELKLGRDQRRAFWAVSAVPLQRWWICGWFRDTNLNASIVPEEGQVDLSKPGVLGDATIAWKAIEDKGASTELERHIGNGGWNGVAYALTRVETPEAMDVYLRFACRGSARLWFNGQLTGPALGGWNGQARDAHTVPLHLSKGRNDLLFKLYRGDAWFSARLTDINGRPIDGVTYTP